LSNTCAGTGPNLSRSSVDEAIVDSFAEGIRLGITDGRDTEELTEIFENTLSEIMKEGQDDPVTEGGSVQGS
jgi:uncharacterized protein YjlB